LEVIAVSDDGTQVLLASAQGAAKPTHAVRIDGRLNAAVRGTLNDAGRRESALSPKEIQARLRAGEAPEQVAKLANVPISRVMRYAGPVISERERIIDQARAAVLKRPRGESGGRALGPMVERRLASTAGLHTDSVAWTARRRGDGAWIVVLTYAAKGGSRSASWLWEPTERVLTSLNALATRLGADDPAPARRKRAVRAASARTAARRSTTSPRRTAAQPAAAPAATTAGSTAARSKNGRVAVPSWSDVLIGVQSPTAARGGAKKTAARRAGTKSAARGRRRS
jgi:hypothetical protein